MSISSCVLPVSSCLSICPWFALCRRLYMPAVSHCLYFPRCTPPFVLRLVLPPATCSCNSTTLFPQSPIHTPARYYTYTILDRSHAPCCPIPTNRHHGPLDIQQQQPPHTIAKQCSATARMGDRQCHVKSINSSRQCNTATPAPALLLWHTSTAARPPTKQSFAPK